ncbi:MAG TPA: AraC family transcriptional regulator [Polyangiaceae bacterium]|nr:AraC family transcriptional regulator [Polyangiaceae bacterium]
MSVSILLIRGLVSEVDASGVPQAEFLARAGLDASALNDSEGRVSIDEYDRLQLLALEMTGDEALGLHMGERASLAAFDVVGHLLSHARTAREGVQIFLRFHRILSDCADSTLTESGDLATMVYEYPRGVTRANRIRAEFGMTVLNWMGRHYVGRRQLARRVFFEHAAPEYAADYRRIFGDQVVFGHSFTGAEFDRALLDHEQLHKDEELYKVLEQQAERRIGRLVRRLGYRDRLKEFLVAQALVERPQMEAVARRFGMSVRSLRRRLTEEGVSYGSLVEEALASVAKTMLNDPNRTIQETAYALGFSDPSAFHRAFKRWTGTTPKQYRERT